MENLYQKILAALQAEDKEQAVNFSIEALEKNEVSIVELYQDILTPALASVMEEYKTDEHLVWREHVRSGIIRTIVELSYPYVLKQRKPLTEESEKVLVICPEFEDHELGAKMVSDFFKLEGFDSTFIGARTPLWTVLQAIDIVKPTYLSISVTNYFNLISVKKMIEAIKSYTEHDVTIAVGGRAFQSNPNAALEVGADLQLLNYEDIKKLSQEISEDETSI
ncbi:MAG TPA: cobalamin-dependent protein [Atopostipes sp.]|nr:cobalamin-dependent protein [Atopostipes sp.]